MNKKSSISGTIVIYSRNTLYSLNYLQFKDVLKICSFFNYNYGTVVGFNDYENLFYENKMFKRLETVECFENATEFNECKLKFSRLD